MFILLSPPKEFSAGNGAKRGEARNGQCFGPIRKP